MELVTIVSAAAGGALCGASAGLLLLVNGRIAGNSSIVAGLLKPWRKENRWRLAWVAGLLAGAVALFAVHPSTFAMPATMAAWKVAVAGLLVGFGTRLGNGCTAGHGVCGVGRMSPRSIVATAAFFATGTLTVTLVRGFGG
jgi:uncharacterized membrane protein YedE/YeeE